MTRKDTLKWFAVKMMNQLDKNSRKTHWRFMPQDYLLNRLTEQSIKLHKELRIGGSRLEVIRRCSNVANYAMMIADNERRFLEK